MQTLLIFVSLFTAISIMSCAAHSNLVPLGKGNLETNVGAGGPFIPLSSVKIPASYFTIGADNRYRRFFKTSLF